MKKTFQFLLWTGVFLVLLILVDQALTRVPVNAPLLADFQEFYQDFRSRLLGARPEAPSRPPAAEPEAGKPAVRPPIPSDQPRFIYVDRDGQLQFAESLAEIPAEFRGQAQKLEQ